MWTCLLLRFCLFFLVVNFFGFEMADDLPDLPQLINLVDYAESEDEGVGFFGSQLDKTMATIRFDPDRRLVALTLFEMFYFGSFDGGRTISGLVLSSVFCVSELL